MDVAEQVVGSGLSSIELRNKVLPFYKIPDP